MWPWYQIFLTARFEPKGSQHVIAGLDRTRGCDRSHKRLPRKRRCRKKVQGVDRWFTWVCHLALSGPDSVLTKMDLNRSSWAMASVWCVMISDDVSVWIQQKLSCWKLDSLLGWAFHSQVPVMPSLHAQQSHCLPSETISWDDFKTLWSGKLCICRLGSLAEQVWTSNLSSSKVSEYCQ